MIDRAHPADLLVGDGDPGEADAQAHPALSAEHAVRMRQYGVVEDVVSGTVLYRRGDRGFDFFLVLQGAVEVRQEHEPGSDVVTVYRDGQFTGELALLNGQASLVSTATSEDSRVVRLRHTELRRMMANEPELGREGAAGRQQPVLRGALDQAVLELQSGDRDGAAQLGEGHRPGQPPRGD